MDNQQDNQPESQVNKESLNNLLAQGVAFEEIIHSKGFELIKVYVESQIQLFASDALLGGIKNWDEYLERRGEVNGLRKLIGQIDFSLDTLKDERSKQQPKSE